jgi:hypothetical protein
MASIVPATNPFFYFFFAGISAIQRMVPRLAVGKSNPT